MTVNELIEQLKNYSGDMRVLVHGESGEKCLIVVRAK